MAKDFQTFAGQATPGIPLISYPTPLKADIFITEIVDAQQPSYQALDYGAAYTDAVTFPSHILVWQHPQNYQYIERIYAAPRSNQDTYNFSEEFSGEDTTKPVFHRTYYTPRASYTPIAGGTLFPGSTTIYMVEEKLLPQDTGNPIENVYGRVQRTYETLPGPSLTEYVVDEQTQIKIAIKKTRVLASTATAANSGLVSGWYVEFKPVSAIIAVKIESQVVTPLPDPLVYYGTRPISLPSTLLSITPVWQDGTSGGDGDGNGATIHATASAYSHTTGEAIITHKAGFNGAALARFTKSFFASPPASTDVPTPTQILPSSGSIVFTSEGGGGEGTVAVNGSSTSKSNSGQDTISTSVKYLGPYITPSINTTTTHNGPNVVYTGAATGETTVTITMTGSSTAKMTVNIPASTPTALNSGDWILDEVKVDQWRLGIWVVYKIEVQIP